MDTDPTNLSKIVNYKISKARSLKQDGNIHFRNADYKTALRSYHNSLLYLKGIHCDMTTSKMLGMDMPSYKPTDQELEEINSLTVDVFNNLAACLMKQEPISNDKIILYCLEVTSRQPNNLKALYRLGLAYFNIRDFCKAHDVLTKALEISNKKDNAVKKLLLNVEKELKKQDDKFKQMFKNSLLPTGT